MAAGIQIFNTSGTVQIDQDYRNFGLVGKGSGVCDTELNPGGGLWVAQVPVASAFAPLLFLRSTGGRTCVWGAGVSGSTWTFHVWSSIQNATFDWFAFDALPASIPDTFGLEVFNAQGQRVFHSSHPPLKVQSIHDDPAGSVSLPSGRSFACAQSGSGFRYSEGPIAGGNYRYQEQVRAFTCTPTNLTVTTMTIVDVIIPPPANPRGSWEAPAPQFIVADVTHY